MFVRFCSPACSIGVVVLIPPIALYRVCACVWRVCVWVHSQLRWVKRLVFKALSVNKMYGSSQQGKYLERRLFPPHYTHICSVSPYSCTHSHMRKDHERHLFPHIHACTHTHTQPLIRVWLKCWCFRKGWAPCFEPVRDWIHQPMQRQLHNTCRDEGVRWRVSRLCS